MLFDAASLPRTPPVKRMHVSDAGEGVIEFTCSHCGHCTGWIEDRWTISENRRGHPCPACNDGAKQTKEQAHVEGE